MGKYIFSVFMAVAAFFSLFTAFSGCQKEPYPWKVYKPLVDTTCDTCSTSVALTLYSLYPSLPASGSIQGSMVLIPAKDSTYRKATATDTYHVTTGFIDNDGDTAYIRSSFWMDTAEVSREEWLRVMADSTDTLPKLWPRTGISWFDAIRYCMKRTALEGLTQVYDTSGWNPRSYPFTPPAARWDSTGYRLPTEDEWEYAARAGTNFLYPTSNGRLDSANFNGHADTTPAAISFNVMRSVDSAWFRLTPNQIYFDHIGRTGMLLHDTVSYLSKKNLGGVVEYSYSLLKYIDTIIAIDSNYIDTFVYHDSLDTSQYWDPDFKEYGKKPIWFHDTLLIYFFISGGDTTYDTLLQRIKMVPQNMDTANPNYLLIPIRTQIDSIDKIDPSILVDSLKDGDSLFAFRTTRVDSTVINGKYLWAGLVNVGSYAPNPYGLRDMAGNAFEWCWDASTGAEEGGRGIRVDYRGRDNGTVRMRRGGDFISDDFYLQCGFRNETCAVSPISTGGFTGFRAVRKAP